MHVLLLAHYFPPDGGPGAQRPRSFARHLPGLGVRCTVLTRAVPAQRGDFDPADAEGLDAVREADVVRAAATTWPELHGALLQAGERLDAADRPDIVLATMSPFQLAPVALELGRRFGVPTVLDLRDPWALDGVLDYRSRWHWRRAFAGMRAALTAADGVIANCEESRRAIVAAMPSLRERTVAIPNGWDALDFAGPAPVVEPSPVLRLVHGGSFLCSELYAGERPLRRLLGWLRHRPEPIDPRGRTPAPLLAALRHLRERGDPAGSAVRLVIVGRPDAALRRCVAESGVADLVELTGYLPHAATVRCLREADALFLTLHGLPAGRRARIVPGKTYEYLASGRPLLAALPAGDARDLVASAPHTFLADPCDPESLAAAVVALHAACRRGDLRAAAFAPQLADYERRQLAGRLTHFLATVQKH
ncbi:MAG: glycosyltransferase [Planctomycetes bacterium]|nr:glycosyltransferase [Planctomycetota bacterium]